MINEDKVREISELAQLKLTAEEVKVFTNQLAKVIEHFDKLGGVKTEGIDPLITPTAITFREREDQLDPFASSPEKILANAPERKNSLFKVPPVV